MEDLGKRLWEQFEEIIQNQIDNRLIFQLRITPEEVKALQAVARSYGRFSANPVQVGIERYWKTDGLIFLLLFVYTKYVHNRDLQFWVGWEHWSHAGVSSDLLNPKIYNYIKSFSDKYALFLYSPNRNEYVSSLRTHAFLGNWTIEKILETLFHVALRYPFSLDQYDREAYLKDTLEQYAEKPSENSEDDDEQDVIPFHFRKSFRMALFLQQDNVLNELQGIFHVLHQAIVANVQGSDRFLKLSDSTESYIHDAVKNFLVMLKSTHYEKLISESIKESGGSRYNFRRPGLYLNMTNLLLTIHIPAQRTFTKNPDSKYSLKVTSDNKKIERLLEYRFYNDSPIYTREEDIEIRHYNGSLAWDVCLNGFSEKHYTCNEKVLYFRSDGNRIDLPLSQEQELYVLVSDECVFECDDASPAKVPDTNYSIYCLQCNSKTLLFVDNKFVSPMAQDIPDLMERQSDVIYESVKIIDPIGETHPVYHSFPAFTIRSKNENMLREEYPVFINNKEIRYSITAKKLLCDGTDDILFDISIPETNYCDSGASVYHIEIGITKQYSKRIFLLRQLAFSFTDTMYFSKKDVRVQNLVFDSCNTFFSGSYAFPMKDNNTRFRLKLDNEEYRLVLQPPLIEATIDGKDILELLWGDNVFDKEISIDSDLDDIKVLARFSDKSEKRLNLVHIANKRTIPLNSLAQWKYMGCDFANIVLVCKNQEKIITTICFRFTFLDAPHFFCNEQDVSQSSLVDKEGLFLICRTIGSDKVTYSGVLTYLATGAKYSFPLQGNNNVTSPVFITDQFVPNGNCKLEIYSKQKLMGHINGIESIEYSQEFQKLYDEPVIEQKEVLVAIGTIIDINCSDAGTIKNFFLRIDDELAGDVGFLAEGYFIHNGNQIYHSEFNPYLLTNIKIDGTTVTCSIRDANSQHPVLDRYGRVNPLKSDEVNPIRIHEISGKVLDIEEYTYDL